MNTYYYNIFHIKLVVDEVYTIFMLQGKPGYNGDVKKKKS